MRLGRRQALASGIAGLAALAIAPRRARGDETGAAADAEVDRTARWLGGIEARGDATDEWRAYAAAEDERWRTTRARVAAMRDWSARALAPSMRADYTLLYPFAGPDALYALALFGGAKRAVLVGLEPVGALPSPASTSNGYFTRLGAALSDVHRLGFFRTRQMSTDFEGGVLPAVVATIARMGGKVTRVTTTRSPDAARVDWEADGRARRLDYVRADLANAALKAAPEVAASLHALAPYVTFVKAAMFLLPEARFSYVKKAILDDSDVVVEDDSGVPYRDFDPRWATRLFGRYETPSPPFEDRVQPDLRAAFERGAAGALPFPIGYRASASRSNLLVAVASKAR